MNRDPEPGQRPPPAYQLHSFATPRLFSEAQTHALKALMRRFSRSASQELSALVRDRLAISLLDVQQCSYFDFLGLLRQPTSMHLAYCLPERLPLVTEMSPSILFPVMDRLAGTADPSPRRSAAETSRPFTKIEQGLADMVTRHVLGELQRAWSAAHAELRLQLAESEHNPLLMQVFPPSEPSIVFYFQIRLGNRSDTGEPSGGLHICMPMRPFESLLLKLIQSSTLGPKIHAESAETRQQVLAALGTQEVTLTAELDPITLALDDVLSLQPGDIVDTQQNRNVEVTVHAAGQRLFRGRGVVQEGSRAVQLTRADVLE